MKTNGTESFALPILNLLAQIPQLWSKFWFESNERFQLDLFRRILGGILFFCFLGRTLDLSFFFTDAGILPTRLMLENFPMTGRDSVLNYLPNPIWAWAFHLFLLLSFLGMAFRVLPRLSTISALFLHLTFLHRALIASYGIDLISVFFLFYLCFADNRTEIASTSSTQDDWQSSLGSVAYRFCQIQICVIYAYAGTQKLQGSHWWNGMAVWDMVANIQIARFDFSWLAHYPGLIAVFTFSALIWEIYFPVLIWIPLLRPYVLLYGVLMHLGILVTIDIPYFSLMMLASTILFMSRRACLKLIGRS